VVYFPEKVLDYIIYSELPKKRKGHPKKTRWKPEGMRKYWIKETECQ